MQNELNVKHWISVKASEFCELLSGRKKQIISILDEFPYQEGEVVEVAERDLCKTFAPISNELTGRKLYIEVTHISTLDTSENLRIYILSVNIIQGENI